MKQKDFEKAFSIYTGMTSELVTRLIKSMTEVIKTNIRNDVRTNLPRMGAIYRKIRAAKSRYDIHSETTVDFPATATAYMKRAGYQQQYMSELYQPTKTFKDARTYPENDLAKQININTGIDILTCNLFVYEFVNFLIAVCETLDKVSFRKLGRFYLDIIVNRPVGYNFPSVTMQNLVYSNFYNKFFTSGGISGGAKVASSNTLTTWAEITTTEATTLTPLAISSVSGKCVTLLPPNATPEVVISDDMQSWTNIGGTYNCQVNTLKYLHASGIWLASNNDNAYPFIYSLDGENWYQKAGVGVVDEVLVIINSEDLNYTVAIGRGDTLGTHDIGVRLSSDGINWSWYEWDSAINFRIGLYAANLGILVAWRTDISENNIAISTVGVVWDDYPTIEGFRITDLVYSPELSLFVAVGSLSGNHRFVTSPDAIVWTLQAYSFDGSELKLIWNQKKNIFLCYYTLTGIQKLVKSIDGVAWQLDNGRENRDVIKFKPSRTLNLIAREV